MKPGKSTLNPHAEAYVPLSKRVLPTKDSAKSPGIENKDGNEAGLLPTGVAPAQYQQQFPQRTEHYYMQHSPSDDFYGSSSQGQHEFTDSDVLDMEFDIDMQYLRRAFRDISEESLSQVYLVNKCDLEETVDMLNQLEVNALNLFASDISNCAFSLRFVVLFQVQFFVSFFIPLVISGILQFYPLMHAVIFMLIRSYRGNLMHDARNFIAKNLLP